MNSSCRRFYPLATWLATLFFLFAGGKCGFGQSISWRPNLDAAKKESHTSNRPLWIHIGADWCQPCRSLETFVFKNPTLIRTVNELVIPVKVEFDEATALIESYQIDSIPFDIFLNANHELLIRRRSPQAIDEFIAMIQAASDQCRSERETSRSSRTIEHETSEQLTGQPVNPATPLNVLREQENTQKIVNPFTGPATGSSEFAPTSNFVGWAPPTNANATSATTTPATAAPASYSTLADAPFQPRQPASNEFALEGDCPVSLILENRWVSGDARYGCRHRGQTYLFASEAYLQLFWNDPDRFSPLLAGHDPVLYHEQGVLVPGNKKNGLFMHQDGVQQIVLFHNAETREKFRAQPETYVAAVRQAMQHASARRQ